MHKNEALTRLKKSGLVVVVRKPPAQQINYIAEALVKGGVGALEITVETPGALEMITDLHQQYGGDVLIGAGTVLNADGAAQAIEAGADFVFSPNMDPATIQMTVKHGKISIPGVMTPTEIVNAHQAGADLVKVFPASVLGPRFFREMQGPLGHVEMMPTGGIGLDNVQEFIRNGAVAVGVGGSLMDKQAIAAEKYEVLTERASRFIELIREAQAE